MSIGSTSSLAMLSQSERSQRKWPSLYPGVEDGQLDSAWLRECWEDGKTSLIYCICTFPLDSSAWQKPGAKRLEDRQQYIYQASMDVNGGIVTIGYPHSWLEWCAEPHSSWSLSVGMRPCQVHKRRRTPMLNRSELYLKAQLPIGKRWTLWPPMERMGILAFFGQLRSCAVGW